MDWFAKLIETNWSQRYRRRFGRRPDLDRPATFNERIGAAMFRRREPRWVDLADKLAVKERVRRHLGDDWVTPNLYTGAGLPPRGERDWPLPFVIKANNRSRPNRIVRAPADIDWPAIEAECEQWLRRPYGAWHGEWHYARIPPAILVEPLLDIEAGVDDIRLWCFGGRVAFIQMSRQPGGVWHNRFFDRDWNPQSFSYVRAIDPVIVDPPDSIAEMIAGADRLAAGLEFVRVDLYPHAGRPRFGEMTFTPTVGLGRFFPADADRRLGDLWADAARGLARPG